MIRETSRRMVGLVCIISGLVAGPSSAIAGPGDSTPLIDAIRTGNRAAARALLQRHVDLNAGDAQGATALHWAVYQDDVELTRLLLRSGARAAAANEYGATPLSVACASGNVVIIGLLLEGGADPNAASPEGETALMTVARTGRVDAAEALIRRGAKVNTIEGWRGQTALMWAAAQGHASMIKALVAAGADVRGRSKNPGPYSALAKEVDDPFKYYYDLAGGRPVPVNREPPVGPRGFTPLLFAVRAGHLDAVNALLTAGADANDILSDGTSALVVAIMNAHYEVATALLAGGADPNAGLQGWTALHQLVWTRKPVLLKTPPNPLPTGNVSDLELLKVLVAHGADVNARQQREPNDNNRNGMSRIGATPFLLAAKNADAEMMRALVDAGADPLSTTAKGTTPLMAAAGVGIWRVGESPGTNDEALAAVQVAFELGGDVNAIDANGDTALHGAAHRGATAIVQFLADHGAALDVANNIGWTPLTIAEGVLHPSTYKTEPEVEALLRRLGANPNAGRRRPVDIPAAIPAVANRPSAKP